ncbi:MAG TPA: tetratricopeptide repeat protein [Bryobacteraceae bacterium]|jgi:tetratricopeptide (TPR) repeat protein
MSETTASASSGQFLRTLSLVALAIAAIFAADTFLAKSEEAESRIEADRLFKLGQSLLDRGNSVEAVERIKDALEIERGNRDYQRLLAQAQLTAGQLADAETTLDDSLRVDSTDGPANLTMARVLVKEGRIREAISFYHRAIYGQWNDDAQANRLKVRFELIDLLARQDSKEELLAELLEVQDQMPKDASARVRIGRLFLAAGSPVRAADVFRGVLREDNSADAYTGLGDADFARGDYRAAESDFESALRLKPEDPAATKGLDLSSRVLTLDPAVRGIGAAERFRRSRILLQMALDAGACVNPPPEDLLDQAEKTLKERVNLDGQYNATETNLDLAGQLWQARIAGCKPAPDPSDPLGLVLAKAAAQ